MFVPFLCGYKGILLFENWLLFLVVSYCCSRCLVAAFVIQFQSRSRLADGYYSSSGIPLVAALLVVAAFVIYF